MELYKKTYDLEEALKLSVPAGAKTIEEVLELHALDTYLEESGRDMTEGPFKVEVFTGDLGRAYVVKVSQGGE